MVKDIIDTISFIRNPINFCKKQKGDFWLKLNGKNIYCTSNDQLIEKLASVKTNLFEKEIIAEILGTNILTTDSNLEFKAIFNSILNKLDVDSTKLDFKLYRSNNGKDIINDIVIDIMVQLLCGEKNQKIVDIFKEFIQSITPILLFSTSFRKSWNPYWKKFCKYQKLLKSEIIQTLYSSEKEGFFKLLLKETNQKYSYNYIIDNCILFLFGIYDNVTITISNLIINNLYKWDYINKTKPPIPFIPKTILEDFEFEGQYFRKSDHIAIMPCLNNKYFFGLGERRCPGSILTFKLVKKVLSFCNTLFELNKNKKIKYGRQRFSWGPVYFGVKIK